MTAAKTRSLPPHKFHFNKKEFKTAVMVLNELLDYWQKYPDSIDLLLGSENVGNDHDPASTVTDFTITAVGGVGDADKFSLARTSSQQDLALLVVNPGDDVTFGNDTDSSIRLTFFTNSNCQTAFAATSRFDLPLWNGKPYLDIDPGLQGTAPTSTHSEGTETLTNIWIMVYEKPADIWTIGRSGGGGPDMGINNP
jgi:hypothetical protein